MERVREASQTGRETGREARRLSPHVAGRQAQICLWDYSDPCNKFPTLYFDLGVDSFFLAI